MTVTSVQAWRAQNTPVEVRLPSGNVALLRKVHLLDLAMGGSIPSTIMTRAMDEKKAGTLSVEGMLRDPEELQRWMGAINPVVIAAFVEPRVGETRTDDTLGIDEISAEDKLAVFAWANAGAERLAEFRRSAGRDVGAAQGGDDVPPAAEHDPGADG